MRQLGKIALMCALCAMVAPLGAQSVGPGGVPGAGGSGALTNCTAGTYACLGLANTFTSAQTAPTLTLSGTYPFSVSASGHSVTFYDSADSQYVVMIPGLYGSSNAFQISSILGYGWSSTSNAAGFIDTGIFRVGKGMVAIGNGAQSDTSGWIQSAAIGNGASDNTDLRGHITLVSGSGTYTFVKAYIVAPTCVAADTTTAAAVKVSTSTTTLTLTGTGTDTLNYICAD